MKVVFFPMRTLKIASTRSRVVAFADRLAAEGHQVTVCFPSSVELWEKLYGSGSFWGKSLYLAYVLVHRIFQLRHVAGADVVVFRGMVFEYGPAIFERIIRAINPRMVYDIDDAVWEKPAYVDSVFLRFQDFDWTWKMCEMCAHGIVGNEYLKERVAKHNPNVTIIPTCVDLGIHTIKDYPSEDEHSPVVLGWTGLWTNLGYFEMIEDVLKELARKHEIVLSVATGKPYALDGVNVVNHEWVLEHEIDYLKEADVGLMPLTYSKRAIGKCAYKALQYMGVGTPCVISPVGMNADVIEDGITGFLADSAQEWYEKLERLIVDPELRQSMGRAAREVVIERYSHDVNYPKFKKVMETVAASRS